MANKPLMEPVAVDEYLEFRDEDFYASKIADSEDMRVLAFCS